MPDADTHDTPLRVATLSLKIAVNVLDADMSEISLFRSRSWSLLVRKHAASSVRVAAVISTMNPQVEVL